MNTPRTLISITRSISSSVVSSNGFGNGGARRCFHQSTSSWPKVANGLFDRKPSQLSVGRIRLDRDSFPPLCSMAFD